jgi:putative sugar O-methyltransferase
LCYEFAKCYGELNGAKSIENFDGSLSGNPENYFYVNGHLYTSSLLDYYIRYAYCCKFLNFDSIDSLLEIGTGSGKQVEIIKKLHPNITFYVLDIPPQLYLSEQYLSKIFPDSVISYKKTRKMTKIPNEREGKIFILGNWKISQIENLKYDLFWNAVSFQEMEPDVVLNYLQFVNRQTRKYVFLYENLKGKEVASVKGNHGVLNQTNLDHYKNGLKDFEIKNSSKVIRPPRLSSGPNSRFMFWEKK